ncbi:uncharacterized protein LOC135096215 [Scylla paramamosain]|uniref:uncharacterized protein LOC135096215 n=1 Tax=Scylla paramamosain TaxID=85552 RepID=UPI0030829F8D
MDTFSRFDVSEWRGEDSLDWAGSVCRRKGLDQTTLDLWAFRGVPGESLRRMTLQDFCDLIGSVYGPLFHAEFEDYCRRREEGQRWRHKTGGSSPYSDHGGQFDLTSELPELDLTSEEIRDLDKYIVGGFQDMDLEGTQSYYDSVDSFPESVAQLSAGPPLPF